MEIMCQVVKYFRSTVLQFLQPSKILLSYHFYSQKVVIHDPLATHFYSFTCSFKFCLNRFLLVVGIVWNDLLPHLTATMPDRRSSRSRPNARTETLGLISANGQDQRAQLPPLTNPKKREGERGEGEEMEEERWLASTLTVRYNDIESLSNIFDGKSISLH